MAHFRLPVPITVCAANPPGRRDLTNFSRSAVSATSTGAVADVAVMTSGLTTAGLDNEKGLVRAMGKVWGLGVRLEVNDSEAKDDVSDEIETAIF